MSCFVMLSPFWQPLCSFVQPLVPMMRLPAAAAGSMEVGLTTVAGPVTLDITTVLRGALSRVRRCVEESTAVPLTVPQR
jgi:hypothetical protein